MSGRGISVVQLYHAWLNSILNEEDLHIANLTELQDGVTLYHLIGILYPDSKDDHKFQASREKIAIQRLQGVLDLLYRNGVKISVGAHEILQGDTKALLDVLWGIILNFFIHTPERPPTQRTVRVAKRNLLDWCKQQQPDLAFNIHASLGKNFGKSDVLARIISTNCRVEESEELIEYLSNAVSATEDQLGIDKDILNPVDIIDGTIDEHALLVYLALVKRKSQLKGKSNDPTSTIPNGIPEVLNNPVLLNTNNLRRSPSPKPTSLRNSPTPETDSPRNSPIPKAASPRNSPIPKAASPRNSPIPKEASHRNSPIPKAASPRNSPIPKADSPRNSPAPKTDSPRNSPAPKTDSPRNSPIPKAASLRNSPIPVHRPVSPRQETSTPTEVCRPSPRYSLLNKVELDFDDNPITFEVPSSSTPRSSLTSPRRSPVPSPNRPLSPATNIRNNRPISPRTNQEHNPDIELIIDLTDSGDNFVENSLLISPRKPVETTPQQTYSALHQRSQSTSPSRTQLTSSERTHSTSPQRTISPQSFNVNHVYSPRNSPSIEADDFRSRSPLGSPGAARRQKAASPLGSPRARSPRLTSPRINGHRGMNGYSTMDPGDRLDFNGFDEKGNGNLSDTEQPNSARSGRTDTSDWLSSSSGSVHAYNVARGNDEIADSGVDTELAEAIKNKVSEHFEIDSQQNTPRVEENPGDVTLTGQTNSGLGMCKSMSNDDLLTMLEAIGHQGKTLRDELINREQELMLMQVQSDDSNMGLGLAQKYEEDVEFLKRENEKLAKEVASAKTAVLPEREIVNTLLSEIGVMREKMDAVETTALSPRDNNSPRLDLDSGFKESVQRLSHSMDNLDQKLGMINQGSNSTSVDSLHDRGSLFASSPETKPPSGAFKHAELRWHDQEKALKEQIAAQRRKINELESMVTLTKNDNKDLQKKLDKASTNIANRVNEMDAMINETRNEMDTIQMENDELKEYRKKDKQTMKKLEEDIETLEKKIGNLQRENSSLTDQLQANMKKSQALEGTPGRLEALTKENTTLKEKLAAAGEEKKQLQQDCTKYIQRCREVESRASRNSSPQKTAPEHSPSKSSRPDSPTKQNTSSMSSPVKQSTSASRSPLKQNPPATSSPVKPNQFVTSTPVKHNVPVSGSSAKSNNGAPSVVTNGHPHNPAMVRAAAMTDVVSSPSVSPISTLKHDPRNVDDQRKSTSSPTKYIAEKPNRYVQGHLREEVSPERPSLNPGNRYQHHERIMIQAKHAMHEAENNPPVIEKKEQPIDLAELSLKYPELDRYSHKAWPDELTRVSPEEQSFEEVVERVSAVSKTLDSEMEKSIHLYQKMQTPKVQPISRVRLRSDESVRSSERSSEPRRTSADERRGDSEHRYTPPPRRTREERPESSKLGHRRTHSASGEKPEKSVAVDESSRHRQKQFGSLQNLSSRDRSAHHAVDHRNGPSGDATASSGRPVYRASSAERLANRGPPARAHQESTPSRTSPQEPNVQTPSRSSDIRNILQKRFGSAPLPPRMSAAMRVRKSDESTPTRPSGQYSDSRPTGHRGTAPVKVVHAPHEAVHQEQYQQTPLSAWNDDSNDRPRDRQRNRESMPRRRMYQNEEESRPSRSEERNPVGSRHESGLKYRDHMPNRESDRYVSREQFDVRDQRQPQTTPPVIMVTPPDEQLKEVPRARQYRRFSGSGPDTETRRAEESESPVYSRDRDGRPPSSHRRTPEMQQRNQAPERQQTRPRSQTPQRSPAKQSQDSGVRERHPSSPPRLRGQGDQPTRQQDMYETGQLVNWRDVARDYGVDVNDDDYPYFGVMNNEPQVQQANVPQYKDYDDPSGEPVVASSDADLVMDANGIYREIPEPSPKKPLYQSHRRAASLDNRNRSGPSRNQNSYGKYNGDSELNNNAAPPSAPLKGNPQLRDSPTHRSASSIGQMSSVSRTEPEPTEIPAYNTNDQIPPKLSASQIAYVDSLIEKYTRT
ncbi:uncharacterized protein LOC135487207 isoform X2 [Lineus longissimus]|uniref:uncharacterized protein LOC135487207 isoform X2 n=1 Tax=Lineus longissimus TaxID=88925 RepID=UPI002B4C7D35